MPWVFCEQRHREQACGIHWEYEHEGEALWRAILFRNDGHSVGVTGPFEVALGATFVCPGCRESLKLTAAGCRRVIE